jgi:hypothetical protein
MIHYILTGNTTHQILVKMSLDKSTIKLKKASRYSSNENGHFMPKNLRDILCKTALPHISGTSQTYLRKV